MIYLIRIRNGDFSTILESDKHDSTTALVCGGRDFNDAGILNSAMDSLHGKLKISTILHGAAAGADALAGEWAKQNGVNVTELKADPRTIEDGNPDVVIAFPGGSGTNNIVELADKNDITLISIVTDLDEFMS